MQGNRFCGGKLLFSLCTWVFCAKRIILESASPYLLVKIENRSLPEPTRQLRHINTESGLWQTRSTANSLSLSLSLSIAAYSLYPSPISIFIFLIYSFHFSIFSFISLHSFSFEISPCVCVSPPSRVIMVLSISTFFCSRHAIPLSSFVSLTLSLFPSLHLSVVLTDPPTSGPLSLLLPSLSLSHSISDPLSC